MKHAPLIRKSGIMAVTGLFMFMAIASTDDGSSSSSAPPETKHPLGTAVPCGGVGVTIGNVTTSSGFPGLFGEKQLPAEGGLFVIVDWKYKNTSNEPIGMFSQPSLNLVSKEGVQYDVDVDASSDYAANSGNDEKIISDLNPGLTSKTNEVFEVSEELFDMDNWFLKVSHDGEEIWFNLK